MEPTEQNFSPFIFFDANVCVAQIKDENLQFWKLYTIHIRITVWMCSYTGNGIAGNETNKWMNGAIDVDGWMNVGYGHFARYAICSQFIDGFFKN